MGIRGASINTHQTPLPKALASAYQFSFISCLQLNSLLNMKRQQLVLVVVLRYRPQKFYYRISLINLNEKVVNVIK